MRGIPRLNLIGALAFILLIGILFCPVHIAHAAIFNVADPTFVHFGDFVNQDPNLPDDFSHISDEEATEYGDFGWHKAYSDGSPFHAGIILDSPQIVSTLRLQLHGSHFYNFALQGSHDTTDGLDGTWDNILESAVMTATELEWQSWDVINAVAYSAYRIKDIVGHSSWALYRWELLVDDSFVPGDPPVADAGEDIWARAGEVVVLDGSASYDPDGSVTDYKWTFYEGNGAYGGDLYSKLCEGAEPTCTMRPKGWAEQLVILNIIDDNRGRDSDTMSIFHQPPAVCGDSVVGDGEACDSDTQSCVAPGGYPGLMTCNSQCTGYDACISSEYCGDTFINGFELCDSNSQDCTIGGYDGTQDCNDLCDGYDICVTEEYCGDDIVNGPEICDGSAQTCTTAEGYAGTADCNDQCDGYDSECVTEEFCGDDIINGPESCDDGAQNGQPNMCNATCNGITTPICGNSVIESGEECDDGNTIPGDGCSEVCEIEAAQDMVWFEAESGTLTSPFEIGDDPNASGGQYIYTDESSGNEWSPSDKMAEFTFNVPANDTYVLWGRVLIPPGGGSDSFFVQIDEGVDNIWDLWNPPSNTDWYWERVSQRNQGVVYANLTAGSHTVRVKQREDGTNIDKIIVTSNLGFVPTDYQPNGRPELLPLGDSITEGHPDPDAFGYRNYLQDEVGVTTYNFVGSFKDPDFDSIYGVRHSGVGGERTDQIEARTQDELSTYFQAFIPGQAVLLHAGTNDVTQDISISFAVDNVEDIINMIDAQNPDIDVYVALVIPRLDSKDADTTTYNAALSAMLETYQAAKPNLYIVDMNSSFRDDTFGLCSGDWASNCIVGNLHPSDAGYNAMAMQWANCMSGPTNTNCNGN